MTVRIALAQTTTGIDPVVNADNLIKMAREAADDGAAMLFTPEMSGLLDRDRKRAGTSIRIESEDATLAGLREEAARSGIWIAIGSLAILRDDGRWANRSFVIDGSGAITARYDKMHMFDVKLGEGDDWQESRAYAAGNEVVVADTPLGKLGLAVCYDLRFPALFDALGRKGCDAIAIPAAFTVPTGRAHWHLLQRARAVEASAFVIAAAQVGSHPDGRDTYGHSLVVDPWGEPILDLGGEMARLGFVEIDRNRTAQVRAALPSLANRRSMLKSE